MGFKIEGIDERLLFDSVEMNIALLYLLWDERKLRFNRRRTDV